MRNTRRGYNCSGNMSCVQNKNTDEPWTQWAFTYKKKWRQEEMVSGKHDAEELRAPGKWLISPQWGCSRTLKAIVS